MWKIWVELLFCMILTCISSLPPTATSPVSSLSWGVQTPSNLQGHKDHLLLLLLCLSCFSQHPPLTQPLYNSLRTISCTGLLQSICSFPTAFCMSLEITIMTAYTPSAEFHGHAGENKSAFWIAWQWIKKIKKKKLNKWCKIAEARCKYSC